jgi:hypothetical protein
MTFANTRCSLKHYSNREVSATRSDSLLDLPDHKIQISRINRVITTLTTIFTVKLFKKNSSSSSTYMIMMQETTHCEEKKEV